MFRPGKMMWPVSIAIGIWALADWYSASLFAFGLAVGGIFAPLLIEEIPEP